MRILMVTQQDHSAPREGGTIRTRAVADNLEQRLGPVDVVAWVPRPGTPRRSGKVPFPLFLRALWSVVADACRTRSWVGLQRVSPAMVREIVTLTRTHNYDAAIIEYSTMVMYRRLIDAPTVIDLHNVESQLLRQIAESPGRTGLVGRLRSAQERWDARQITRLEANLGRVSTHITVVSDHDAMVLRELIGTRAAMDVAVAPNGFTPGPIDASAPRDQTVVFVATLSWQPNIDAALWLAREVWPLVVSEQPEARLQIIGRSPSSEVRALAGGSVQVHADVPDVGEFVRHATVATAPLLASGGTRLKILEALGAGTPVVSTTAGALGLEHLAGDALQVVNEPADFARALVDHLQGRGTRDRLAIRAMVASYEWERTLDPLVEMCRRLGESGTAGGRPGVAAPEVAAE